MCSNYQADAWTQKFIICMHVLMYPKTQHAGLFIADIMQ
jgi:hypothetical protein